MILISHLCIKKMISVSEFIALPPDSRRLLLKQLQSAHKGQISNCLRIDKPDIACPFCKSRKFSNNGFSPSGKARYVCVKCQRTFSETTGTPLHALKKQEQFFKFLDVMSGGYQTLRKMADTVGVTTATAFQWRHKILNAMNPSKIKYEGITDFNTKVVSFSRKGLRTDIQVTDDVSIGANVLAVADYSNNSELTLLSIGALSHTDFSSELTEKLRGEAIVIAPWKLQVAEFSRSSLLGFTLFRPERQYNKFDVRQADKLHNEMDKYVRKQMRGVSTKYLQVYSEWIDRLAGIRKVRKEFWALLLKNQMAWGRYVNREFHFSEFMKSRAEAVYVKALNREWKSAMNYLKT